MSYRGPKLSYGRMIRLLARPLPPLSGARVKPNHTAARKPGPPRIIPSSLDSPVYEGKISPPIHRSFADPSGEINDI
jgi:hypothetical protein